MMEQLQTLQDVGSRLDALGLRWMVTGSMAMNHYATPRMTRDIDVVVALDAAVAGRLAESFAGDYYIEAASVRDAARHRSMFGAIHLETMVKVDFVVRKVDAFRRLELERRRRVEWEETGFWVVSPEDLLLSKLVWSRDGKSELQMRDVRNLVASVGGLDRDYLSRWATDLEVADLLAEVLP